ncbi:MAG: CBS domain-containing protein [Bacillaceae bacterium]|jgi:Predicted signal-transduction protein containing cAMP-binding and CBS domains|uniref:CBS domain-containing protein n=2 Tax=Aeribacillus TaxID=1055323 RepID=A0A165YEX2_9BACI|nr:MULTISPECIES: CBS domain-containing protein [Aeribacillus]REJ16126.1 MAG: CBS domain-containing protein [Bacillaceae bacterium]ASS89332.1 CBS domain-containing protein [Aeribacillus pallidus]KZM53733.1 CBS domain-containing protein [Aeribacillus pallidus]KZN97000.1 CBS domain-containing protein [Aeribacillus pallidus]MDR9794201.1 CBS domain-containing protein [Aeribacillus pallidus]
MDKIRDIMSSNVISVSSNQTVQEAAQLMRQHNVGAIPVADNGQLKGIITDRDITLRSTAQGKNESTTVAEVMSTNPVCCSPDASLQEAAQIMAQNQIRRLPVVENNQVVGMVALGDLATNKTSDEAAGEALTNISEKDLQ